MSDINKQDLKQEAVPFFARYLEGQINFIEEISDEETQAVVGSGEGVKKKLPNNEKHPLGCGGKVMTEKYPSDNEDVSGGGILVTRKYPSDNEDVSGGEIAMTLKYPSDNEDASSNVG
jgi:hypothetical protein